MNAGGDRERPLSGITVISIEQAIAAPFATRQLADLGARVIKIERPGTGDFARAYDRSVNGMSSHFVWTNRTKESLALDLKHARAREVLERLLETADVFVHNVAPQTARRLGITASVLRPRFDRLVVCEISGYGEGGPYASRKAYDLLIQSEAGLLSITGTPEEPSKAGISIADIAGAMYAFSGILAALFRRDVTGTGASVQVSLFDAMTEWMGYPLLYTSYSGAELPRTGAAHASIAPYGPYRTQDGQTVFLAVQNEREWRRLCTHVLERQKLADDARFQSNVDRVRNRDALESVIADVVGSRSFTWVVSRLEQADIAFARLNRVEALRDHPQLRARDRWREIGSPVGPITALRPPLGIDRIEPRMGPVPDLGEHTIAILRSIGYDAGAVGVLISEGVVEASSQAGPRRSNSREKEGPAGGA